MNTPLTPDEQGQSSTDPNPFAQFLEQWLSRATPELEQVARLAAMPHDFDLTLLNWLRPLEEDTESLLQSLVQQGLVEITSSGKYIFQPLLRQLLLERWQTEAPQTYRQASARAAAFFRDRPEEEEMARLEYVYHQLGANNEQGIEALRQELEVAWSEHDVGQAELLGNYANEQMSVLGDEANAWLLYFQARLDLLLYHYLAAEAKLNHLQNKQLPALLAAQVQFSLAETILTDQRWTEASIYFARALELFLSLEDDLGVGKLYEARGLAYLRLASNLGGFGKSGENDETIYQRAWHMYQHAPFLIYRWFSRRLDFLPNLYFGTDYQDWIIIRLLFAAVRELEEALHYFQLAPSTSAEHLVTAEIRLSDLYHRLERWSEANRIMKRLTESAVIQNSPYRKAILQLARGRAALHQQQWTRAESWLQSAHTIFLYYLDHENLAQTSTLLGDLAFFRREKATAVAFYVESAEQSSAIDDLVTATHTWYQLHTLSQQLALPTAAQALITALASSFSRRAYVARFPGKLLRRFRQLAIYIALPIAYLMTGFLVLIAITMIGNFELNIRASLANRLPFLEFVTTSLILLFGLSIGIWLYEFIYVSFGRIFVRRLQPAVLAQQHPTYIVTVPEGILVRNENGDLQEIVWAEVEKAVSLNRSFWRIPQALISRLLLISDSKPLQIEGITDHYKHLQQDIEQHLSQVQLRLNHLDFSFLRSPETWAALFLVALLAAVEFSGILDPQRELAYIGVFLSEGQSYNLVAASLIFYGFKWGFYVVPLVGLSRLLRLRAATRRLMDDTVNLGPTWPIWLTLLLFLLFIIVGILGLFA